MTENKETHTFTIQDVADILLPDGMVDCERLDVRIEDGQLVVEFIDPKKGTKKPQTGEAPKPKKEEKLKGGDLSREAGMLCANPQFQAFLEVVDAEKAKLCIYQICGVTSRAMIDHDQLASKEWNSLVAEFEFWKRGF